MIYHTIDDLLIEDKRWRRIAKKFTKCEILADELLHQFYEAYIRLKTEDPTKIVDAGYVYTALYNLHLKHIRTKKKEVSVITKYTIENPQNVYDFEFEQSNQIKIDCLNNGLNNIKWFHKTIFEYVIINGISMRSLAKQTGIHFNVIQKSVADTKKYLLQYATNN